VQAQRSHSADPTALKHAAVSNLSAPLRSYSADWATLSAAHARPQRPPNQLASVLGRRGSAPPWGAGSGSGGAGVRRAFFGYQVTTEGSGLIRTSSTGGFGRV